jgi:Raf kinase inhibitor-like YbhB/YbcL family protein
MQISSPDFRHGAKIPEKFTYNGNNKMPTLVVSTIPKEAESLAIVVEDPDAPQRTWTHMVAWNIPIKDHEKMVLNEYIVKIAGEIGENDFGTRNYGGPFPTRGSEEHRYFFKAYALPNNLDLPQDVDKEVLDRNLNEKAVDAAMMVGTFTA